MASVARDANAVGSAAGKRLIRVAREGRLICSELADIEDPGEQAQFLQAHVASWQGKGVDGMSFTIANGQWWRSTPLADADVRPSITAFQAVGTWGEITNNFLFAGSSVWAPVPAADWFSDADWASVLSNTWRAAGLAVECGFKGVLLDPEQYNCPATGAWRLPFYYKLYAEGGYLLAGESTPRPFEEVAAQVRLRGTQYAATLTDVYPDIVLFVLGLYGNTWREVQHDTGGVLEDAASSLWPAFIDGLLLGLGAQATLVSATEKTYCDSRYADMLAVREECLTDAFALSTVPALAAARITFAVGIWTDAGWGEDRFSYTNERVNQRRPEWHKHAVHNALAASDEYAWIYGELPWMTASTTTLMEAYWQATKDGRDPQDLAWVPDPWPDLTDYTAFDAARAAADAAHWVTMADAGWYVATELPTSWRFWFDTDNQLRCRDHAGEDLDDSAWPLISTLSCWQSQGFDYTGQAVYRVWFDAPPGLDPESQDIILSFGGYSPGTHDPEPGMYSWMDGGVNGKGCGVGPMIDVTDMIRPGTSNLVAVRVINKKGPAGLMGHVKLLVTPKIKPPDVLLDEDFDAYADGTWLSSIGWTSINGDVQITNHWMTGSPVIQGSTITAGIVPDGHPGLPGGSGPTRLYKTFSRPVRRNEHLKASVLLHDRYAVPLSWFGIGDSTVGLPPNGVLWGCNGTEWQFIVLAPLVAVDVIDGPHWSVYDTPTWDHAVVTAEIYLDAASNTVRGVLKHSDGVTEYTSAVVPIIDKSEEGLDSVFLRWTGLGPGIDGLDIDDILVEVQTLPAGTVLQVR